MSKLVQKARWDPTKGSKFDENAAWLQRDWDRTWPQAIPEQNWKPQERSKSIPSGKRHYHLVYETRGKEKQVAYLEKLEKELEVRLKHSHDHIKTLHKFRERPKVNTFEPTKMYTPQEEGLRWKFTKSGVPKYNDRMRGMPKDPEVVRKMNDPKSFPPLPMEMATALAPLPPEVLDPNKVRSLIFPKGPPENPKWLKKTKSSIAFESQISPKSVRSGRSRSRPGSPKKTKKRDLPVDHVPEYSGYMNNFMEYQHKRLTRMKDKPEGAISPGHDRFRVKTSRNGYYPMPEKTNVSVVPGRQAAFTLRRNLNGCSRYSYRRNPKDSIFSRKRRINSSWELMHEKAPRLS